jgi:hypothetical protein
MHEPVAGRGNVGLGSAGTDQFEQRIGVITAVRNDVAAFETFKQRGRCAQVVGLSRGQDQAQR